MTDFPCKTCISLARCNARIPLENDPGAIDTFMVYKECSIIRDWSEQFWNKQVDKDIWETILRPMKDFFDNIKLKHSII